MRKTAIVAASALALAAGCARFSTKQTDLSYDDQGKPQRTVTTRASAWTFFSARSALSSFKASQTDKTQSATVGSLTQEADGTNVVAVLEAIATIVKAVRPTP